MNLALKVAEEHGGLKSWLGFCMELADEVIKLAGRGSILWVDPPEDAVAEYQEYATLEHHEWSWHAAPIIDGIVHDAWFPMVMLPPREYVQRVFTEPVRWEIHTAKRVPIKTYTNAWIP